MPALYKKYWVDSRVAVGVDTHVVGCPHDSVAVGVDTHVVGCHDSVAVDMAHEQAVGGYLTEQLDMDFAVAVVDDFQIVHVGIGLVLVVGDHQGELTEMVFEQAVDELEADFVADNDVEAADCLLEIGAASVVDDVFVVFLAYYTEKAELGCASGC